MALALEIVLKAKVLLFTGDINKTHDHAKLFSKFPDREKEAAEARYTRLRHPAMRQTLVEALSYSATVFVKWRYMHEVGSVEASGGEMLAAFSAIADDL